MGICALILAMSVSAAVRSGPPEDELTGEQFLRLVRSQQSAIRDVAFAFEGELVFLHPKDKKTAPLITFQGRYALRSDGATFLEHYFEGEAHPDRAHPVKTALRGEGEMAYVSPSWKADPVKRIAKSGGGPGSMFAPDSPETWLFLWRLQSLKNSSDFGFSFLGWEDVDGHRCAHVEFVAHPNVPARVRQELWVDLERGAHPLRIKNAHGNQTVYLIDEIRLEQFPLESGEKIWFPVGGQFSDYSDESGYTNEPYTRVTSYVLNDTLFFNQGLQDGVFHIEGAPFRPTFQPKRDEAAPPPRVQRRRVQDYVTVEKKLDAALADPARRDRVKDASVSTRDESANTVRFAWGFGLSGAVVLLLAAFVALRRRIAG